jgi:hypothetical protein
MPRTPKFPRLLRTLWATALTIPSATQPACPQMLRPRITLCPEGPQHTRTTGRSPRMGAMPGVREIFTRPAA